MGQEESSCTAPPRDEPREPRHGVGEPGAVLEPQHGRLRVQQPIGVQLRHSAEAVRDAEHHPKLGLHSLPGVTRLVTRTLSGAGCHSIGYRLSSIEPCHQLNRAK
jgi:hypothetical protein